MEPMEKYPSFPIERTDMYDIYVFLGIIYILRIIMLRIDKNRKKTDLLRSPPSIHLSNGLPAVVENSGTDTFVVIAHDWL
jgi:hypothetical protein